MDATAYYPKIEIPDTINSSFSPAIGLAGSKIGGKIETRGSKSRGILSIFFILMLFSISSFLLWSTNYGIWKLGYNRVVSFFLTTRPAEIVYFTHEYESKSGNQSIMVVSQSDSRPITVVNPQMDVSTVFIYHTVSPGETLWKIAKSFNQDINRIVEFNPQIKNPNLIFPGMRIRIASR